jgi:methyl coenzyme M reductase alpha subunit
MRVPVSAYAPLVSTLQIAHQRGLFRNDVSPSSIFAVQTGEAAHALLLSDWGSAATAAEMVGANLNIPTRRLYYNNTSAGGTFGAAADLCALVRSAFYLTQATFNSSRAANYDGLKALLQL